jgi:MFS transporter, PPP family, 3-phenylpropionic acid transporter
VERAPSLPRSTPRLKAVYFLFYGGLGANLSFFAPYLRGLGFSGHQIGRVQMVGSLAAAPAGLLWAIFADRLGAHGRAAVRRVGDVRCGRLAAVDR